MNDSAPRQNQRRRGRLLALALAVAVSGPAAGRAQNAGPPPGSPILIYFPPDPPPLGAALPAASAATGTGARWPAPAALAPFIFDPFYAPLSTRLAKDEVGDDLQFRLDTYRQSKAALLAELRAKLDTLKDADAATRRSSLEDFARDQAPRLAALEAGAEELRQSLAHSRTDQREYLRWGIDLAVAGAPDEANLSPRFREVVRMDAYFRDGLSPDQRRLLRELAVLRGSEAAGWFYFSPATVRIRLPGNLPPALAAKLAAYAKEKAALAYELLAILHPRVTPPGRAVRPQALWTLAAAQAPRFAALESAAEDIRRGLAALQDPAVGPALPPVPSKLNERIAAYRRDKLALQQELLAQVDAVRAAGPAGDPALGERIQEAIAAFTRKNADRYAALDGVRDSIHADLARQPDAGDAGGAAGSADALAKKFAESLSQLRSYWDYRDYQTAVFQPGLSPAQRRLLLDGALEKLSLPLPGAEIDPGRR